MTFELAPQIVKRFGTSAVTLWYAITRSDLHVTSGQWTSPRPVEIYADRDSAEEAVSERTTERRRYEVVPVTPVQMMTPDEQAESIAQLERGEGIPLKEAMERLRK